MVEGLFGPQPAERVRGRGRPAHEWDRGISIRICNLFACGRSLDEVAAVIGISKPTLRKVYFSEVAARSVMALKVKSEQMARLTQAAIGGNVAAEKALAGMIQSERVAATADRIKDRGRTEEKAPAIGKKEAALEAATKAEGRFARRKPPAQLTLQ